MTQKIKNTAVVCIMASLLLLLSGMCIFGEHKEYSESERRVLADCPEISAENILSGSFMKDFEVYAADSFPARDSFRSVKAFTSLNILRQLDTNGLYVENGYISKKEYPLVPEMQEHACERFEYIYRKYLADKDMKLYFSIVPDKNYFLAEKSGRLSLNYKKLVDSMRKQTSYMQYIDIFPLLRIEDYYFTDTHWKQECITDAAEKILVGMEHNPSSSYTVNTLKSPFFGVYSGQLALPSEPDTIQYLTNEALDNCIVTGYDTGKPVILHMYDMEKADGADPYEMFLSGTQAVMTIENPSVTEKRELIIFRDSFGSSLAPLLAEGYSKITLADIRYIRSDMLGELVDFEADDVLFLYSTLILNNSLALK